MNVYYSNHPNDVKYYTTEQLRSHFLIEKIFIEGEINLFYSHNDRIVFGGVTPTDKHLKLEAGDEFRVAFFLQRRELGVINIGGRGSVIVDGKEYEIDNMDGIYVGLGSVDVVFTSVDASNPAKFYINSCPAHRICPTKLVSYANAIHKELGVQEGINRRTLNQYIHPDVLETCQLSMGVTQLHSGSAWNTMPSHTHERRMEVYMYFDIEDPNRVFHMMGEPNETRHIVVANEQAVISPSWSIHSGVGTKNFAFIWGMCGENQNFDDMDTLYPADLK